MSTPSLHPTFRRATLADRRAMLEICATVWRELTPAYLAERVAAKAVYQWDEVECCFEARA